MAPPSLAAPTAEGVDAAALSFLVSKALEVKAVEELRGRGGGRALGPLSVPARLPVLRARHERGHPDWVVAVRYETHDGVVLGFGDVVSFLVLRVPPEEHSVLLMNLFYTPGLQ